MILCGAAFVMAVLATDRLALGPLFGKMKLLDEQIHDVEANVRQSMYVLLRKDQIIADSKKLVEYSVVADNPEKQMTDFLKEVETTANRSQVSLLFVRPGATSEDKGMIRHLATLECEAQMPELATFFHNIESSNALLRVEKYEIQPKTKESSVARCSMTISKTVMPLPKV